MQALPIAILGCLFGTAVGDALGLPAEGLSPRRREKLFGPLDRHRFFFGRGMMSDDTEHTCLVARSLAFAAGDEQRFQQSLARELRLWLLGLPAGVGYATLRATLKLCFGIPPHRSGVFSAGNGPAMRSALIGVCHGSQPDVLRRLVRVSTTLTHTDPKANHAAFAVALAAFTASQHDKLTSTRYVSDLRRLLAPEAGDFLRLVELAAESAEAGRTTQEFASQLGLGSAVTGYCYHSVPIALHACMRYQNDFRSAVLSVIDCGGDTDTTAAITGAIVGSGTGIAGIPEQWRAGLWDWPRSQHWMRTLASNLSNAVASPRPLDCGAVSYPALLLRNAGFGAIVIGHGFRRLLPPY